MIAIWLSYCLIFCRCCYYTFTFFQSLILEPAFCGSEEAWEIKDFFFFFTSKRGFPGGSVVKNPPANARRSRMRARSMVQEDPLEQEMATHASILA